MIRTFVDSSLLIAAIEKDFLQRTRARNLLLDTKLEFVSSKYIINETLPFTIFQKRSVRETFLRKYFDSVAVWPTDYEPILDLGFEISAKYGVGTLDALHIATAYLAKAEQLLTLERPTSPFLLAQEYVEIITYYEAN